MKEYRSQKKAVGIALQGQPILAQGNALGKMADAIRSK